MMDIFCATTDVILVVGIVDGSWVVVVVVSVVVVVEIGVVIGILLGVEVVVATRMGMREFAPPEILLLPPLLTLIG